MQAKSWLILKVLMNRYHEGDENTFLEGMNQEGQQMLLDQKVVSKEVIPAFSNYRGWISKIHYSWIIPKLSKLSKDKANLLISLFPEPLSSKLKEALKVSSPQLDVPEKFRDYLFHQLYPALEMDEVKPIEYLATCQLTPLLTLKKGEMVDLIDFLGVYDLAEEVKRIIDKKKLSQIYETLTPKKHEFLRQCVHLRDKLSTPKMNLEHWDGNHDKLNKVLYERGLARLGYALSGNEPDFIWYIVHMLDTGRGTDLMKRINNSEATGVTNFVTIQVLNTIKFLKG